MTQGRKQRRRFFTLASKRREDNPRRRRWRRVQPRVLTVVQPEVGVSYELWGILACRQGRVHARPEVLLVLGLAVSTGLVLMSLLSHGAGCGLGCWLMLR